MKRNLSLPIAISLILLMSCTGSEISDEFKPLVQSIDKKIRLIDSNHRVQIIEDDFHDGDSIYKIRAYYMGEDLVKVVSIMHTSEFERDDYFYFDQDEPIFSGHMVNEKNANIASEFKYYYENGKVVESLFWEDNYEPGVRFPHERFEEYKPNIDSLMRKENERLAFCMEKLETEGFEVLPLNENLNAN